MPITKITKDGDDGQFYQLLADGDACWLPSNCTFINVQYSAGSPVPKATTQPVVVVAGKEPGNTAIDWAPSAALTETSEIADFSGGGARAIFADGGALHVRCAIQKD